MLCLLDKTFCFIKCANTACARNLNEEFEREAKKLGLPLSLGNFKTDDCGFIPVIETENE